MIKYSQRLLIPRFYIHTDYWRIKEHKIHLEKVEAFKESLNNAATIQKKIDTNTQIAYQIQYPALFTTATPVKHILATYLQNREFQNEDLVGQTLLLLGQAYQGRGQRSYFDSLDFKDTLGFDVLIQDLQYISDYKALTQAIHGLALLGVKDIQHIVDQAFKTLQPKENTLINDTQFRALLQELFPQNLSEPEDNILHEIEVLIKQAQEDIYQAIDAIQTIRQLYIEMVELSKEEFISVNTNIKMLDFEEALVSNGLIAPREILKQDISLTMETAIHYLSGGSLDMLKFISTIMKLRYKQPHNQIPQSQEQIDYGDLILAVSKLKGKEVATRLIESQTLLTHSNKLKLAQAFANAGLFQLSKQYLIEANEDSLDSLMTAVSIGFHDQQFNFQYNLSTLTLDQLIGLLTYSGLQGQRLSEGINELKDRLSYLHTIYDLTSIQQERIQTLGIFYKQRFIQLEFNIQHSELYNVIKGTLPKQVVLIDEYDLSYYNEINGYALLRSKKYPFMTIQDFLGLNKDQFKQKIINAFNLTNQDIQLFNTIHQRLEQLNVEHSDQELNPNVLFDIQLIYLKKRALKCLNNLDDLHKLQLKQALIDIEQRANIIGLNYSFKDLIDQIKTVPIDFPKWYGLVPSQTIYNAKQSLNGFKVSLLSNNIFNSAYCLEEDLIDRLKLNGIITNLAPFPNPEKLRIQSIIPTISKQVIRQAADDKDEFNGFLELRRDIIRDSLKRNPDTSDFFVVNLLNFQSELKTKNLPEIVDTIFNLGIWDKIVEERISGKKYEQPKGLFISRNPQVLLQQKLTPNEQSMTLKYLKDKLNQNEALNDLIKMRQELKQKLIKDVANHQVSPKTVTQVMEKVNNMISDKIDEIQCELKRQHSSLYFRQKTNYIDILFKEKDLEKLEIKGSIDNYLDPDILHGLGQYVTIKRSRAEEKLLTYYLMYKQINGQQLNEKELKFLDTLDLYNPNITITQLLVSDLNLPQSVNSNIMNFKDFSASDVIFQLSTLFDDQLFNDIVQKKYWKKQGLQYQMRRRDSSLLLQLQEKQVWIEQARLNQKEIKDIKDMLQLTKVSDAQVEPLNKTDLPLQNIYSWIYAKSSEKIDLSVLQSINHQLWESIFQTKYNETTSQQLHEMTENLLLRFYILQQNPVNQLRQLITMILTHKNLSPLDKQNLQGFKKIVQFNSEDILNICKAEPITTIPEYISDMCYPYFEKLNI